MVGADVPVTLSIDKFDLANPGEIQTIFSTPDGGEIQVGDEIISSGMTYTHDYRNSRMKLEFIYRASTNGEKNIVVEVHCNGVVRKANTKLTATSPETAMRFSLPDTPIIPLTPTSIGLSISSNNEAIKLSGIFVKGEGNISLDGKTIDKDTPVAVQGGINRLVLTFNKSGEHVIDFFLHGRYGEPHKETLRVNVQDPKWSFEVTKQKDSETIELGKAHSFIFNIKDESEGNYFNCKYRFLSGNAELSFNGVIAETGVSFDVMRGSTIALITPKTTGKISIEFTITDRFGTEKKDTAVFNAKHPLGNINLSVSPQTQSVLVGDEATANVSISEDNYNESFTLKFEKLNGSTYSLLSSKEVSKGTHVFRYTPTETGVNTFRVTATDKNKQSSYEIFTMEARAQQISVTAPKLEYTTDIHKKVTFEINVTEKGYNGRMFLYWDIDPSASKSTLYSVENGREQEISPRNYTEIKNGKNVLAFLPHFVGKYPIKFTLKDERNQTLPYNLIHVTSQAQVTVSATTGGRVEGTKKISTANYRHSVKATPNHGYDFIHWYKTGESDKVAISTNANYSFVVSDNTKLTALFRLKAFIIKVAQIGQGAVSIKGATGLHANLQYGSNATIIAKPTEGWTFKGWYLSGKKVSDNATYSFKVSDNATYEARFEVQKMNLNISSTAGGVVRYGSSVQGNHNAQINYGNAVNITAIPNEKYRFIGWYSNDRLVSQASSYSFVIKSHTTLEARFELMIYNIKPNISHSEAGSVNISPNKTQFEYGDQVSISCSPNQEHRFGYDFSGWYNGAERLTPELIYSFNVKGPINPIAKFIPKKYPLTVLGNYYSDVTTTLEGASSETEMHYGEEIHLHVSNHSPQRIQITISTGTYRVAEKFIPARQDEYIPITVRGPISISTHKMGS